MRDSDQSWWEASAGETQWIRLRVEDGDPSSRPAAYHFFYERYSRSVHRFLRRRGVRPSEAGDLAQEFFARCLERRFLERADPGRGRFRGYLRTALVRFLIDHWSSPRMRLVWQAPAVEPEDARAKGERAVRDPLDEVMDREWAEAVLRGAFEDVAAWYASQGRADHFEAIRRRLTGRETSRGVAEALGVPEARIDAIACRGRTRLIEAIRRRVHDALEDPRELTETVEYLFQVLRLAWSSIGPGGEKEG